MEHFEATIQKFGSKGEKSGWSYIELPQEVAAKLAPDTKVSFRVKGFLDDHPIEQVSTVPMGDGLFIIAINAAMRKGIKKKAGALLQVRLARDTNQFVVPADFQEWLSQDEGAMDYFHNLPASHQRYWVNWIAAVKGEASRENRMKRAVVALSQGFGFAEMLRAEKAAKLRN
ncbi:MAG: DUF1905 domain-containing protein [Bacteroidetes bacterium]|nr:DUF1905 domain-containing protein [Bacteroidota bacterium]